MKFLMTFWGLSVGLAEVGFANKIKPEVGTVIEVNGAPDVLREPSKILSDDQKSKAKSGGYVTVMYKDSYWKAYPIVPGSKIYYGDVLSSGAESKMVLTLQDGFKVILAKNTKVRLTPNFIKNNSDSTLKTWVQLLNGKIRAYLYDHNEKPQTEFRTRTIAMGVRGTDFMLTVDEQQSKLLAIDGEIFARPIEKQEAEMFDRASEAFIRQDESQLNQQVNQLQTMERPKEISLTRGLKIERSERSSAEEREDREPQTQAVNLEDLKEAQEIGQNIQQLVQDNKQNELKTLTDEHSDQPIGNISEPTVPVELKPLLVRVGVENINYQHEDIEASGGGLSLSLDYQPNPYSFVSLGLAQGDWDLHSIHAGPDRGPADFEVTTDSYSHYLVGFGGRWPFTDAFRAGGRLSYIGARRLTLQDRNDQKMEYRINSSLLFLFEASYRVWHDWEIFLSLGGGATRAKVHSSDPINSNGQSDYTIDFGQGYARFGIGRQFDFP